MNASGAVLREVKDHTRAALTNEMVTRKRVDALEGHAQAVAALLSRGFVGRLRWLLLGW